MEPVTFAVSIVAILNSASSLTLNTLQLLQRSKKGNAELESQLSEIVVVMEVLQECKDIVQASQNTKIPRSIERAIAMCDRRFQELVEVMNLIQVVLSGSNSPMGRLKRRKTLMETEPERKSAFKNFRSVVLLLRDLCADIRLQQQLVDMSAGLADLFMDRYDWEPPQRAISRPGHIYMDEEPAHSTDEREAEKPLDPLSGIGNWRQANLSVKNATILVGSGSEVSSTRAKYMHLRAKMDTGCDENLITMKVVKRAQIDQSLLKPIQEEDQFEFTMLNGFSCAPEFKITLSWYQDCDEKMRRSDFYVVKEGPFDMLIGSRRFAQDFRERQALPVGKRRKNKASRKREQEEHTRHLIDEEIEEIQERNEQKTPGQPSGGAAALSLSITPPPPPSTAILPSQKPDEKQHFASPLTTPPSPLPSAPHVISLQGQTSPEQGQTSPGQGPMSLSSSASPLSLINTKPLPMAPAQRPNPSSSLSPRAQVKATLPSPEDVQAPQTQSQQSQVPPTVGTSQTPQLLPAAPNQADPIAMSGALAPQLSSASYSSSLSASHGPETTPQASIASTNTGQNGTAMPDMPGQTVVKPVMPLNNGNNTAAGSAKKRGRFFSFLRTRKQNQ
ncbi:hypothetical protein AYO22_07233 [Fonsecaea multimorphosa]|nr:hypothetical protein AYO22_07233 [Fonsecaea multimorphosa]